MSERPAIYDNITFGRSPPPREGEPATAEIGAPFSRPDLALSYLGAAHELLKIRGPVKEIAIPVAYLQRHAWEVALKDLISSALYVKALAERLTRIKGGSDPDVAGEYPPTKHGLDEVTDVLRAALAAIGTLTVPLDMVEMTNRLSKIDAGSPERLRYATVKTRKANAASWRTSFEAKETLYIGETQGQLETLFAAHFSYMPDDPNLATDLAQQGQSLEEQIVRLIGVQEFLGTTSPE